MSSSAASPVKQRRFEAEAPHICATMMRADVKAEPFPHFYATDVFPLGLYNRMLDELPPAETYEASSYGNRYFCTKETMQDGFWAELAQVLLDDVAAAITRRFSWFLAQRFKGQPAMLMNDARLIMDRDGYEIKPHTDHPDKVISLLFYLARDDSMKDLGTAIYAPRDPAFECDGRSRHPFDQFEQVWRAPMAPNSVFGFMKTRKAFHGVPAIQRAGLRRDVLLLNIYNAGEGSGLRTQADKMLAEVAP